jgi:hypothetical protein
MKHSRAVAAPEEGLLAPWKPMRVSIFQLTRVEHGDAMKYTGVFNKGTCLCD